MAKKWEVKIPHRMNSATKINTITAAWQKTLADAWGAPAVYSVDGKVLRTFMEIEAEAALFGEKLAQFAPGDVVAIQIGNKPHWPALLLACLRAGLVVLPLGTHIERAEFELALDTCRVRGRIGFDGGKLDFAKFDAPPLECNGPPPALLKLTSGTTSTPRAIRFSEHQLAADCENICDTMGFGPADINFGVIPFSHSYGFSNLLTPLLCRAVPLVCADDRLPRAILGALAASRATVFPGMPVFYQKLAELENPPALPDLRLCISAGAPLLKHVAESFTKKFALKIHAFYGASECGGICYDAGDAPDYEDAFVGQPMKNVAIKFTDAGENTSRIEVSSAAVGDGYFPTADPETLGAGHFTPSDLLAKTPRGFRIAGRVSDIINVAGRKLNPLEVEARLLEFPGVKQVIVFGIPSALRHEEAVACIAGTATAAELMAHAARVLSAWQVPKDIWLVDEIPCNERGKISRRELAARYLAQRGA
ncbi:MAG TPA: class I adenylate-forming enzyme family protein [Chthoniobacteraceae bacterium]|nr:class I adenylate-forming enzyme family protein [Chthoniobacteraceae bacterium]